MTEGQEIIAFAFLPVQRLGRSITQKQLLEGLVGPLQIQGSVSFVALFSSLYEPVKNRMKT